MNIIAVDDERLALRALAESIHEAMPDSTLTCFTAPSKALAYAEKTLVDVAFLDIKMGGMNGLVLAKKLKELHGQMNIIFTTGYSEYALPAFSLPASGYIMKPVSTESVRYEIENLRYPVAESEKTVRIQTFGHFEVFVHGRPLPFSRAKSKEILAYLTDRRGAAITRKDIAAVLWGDQEYTRSLQTHLQILITDMMRTLKEVGADDIIIHHRGSFALDISKVDCDYYNFIAWDSKAINAYTGEYMSNYSWALFTEGVLNDKEQTKKRDQ